MEPSKEDKENIEKLKEFTVPKYKVSHKDLIDLKEGIKDIVDSFIDYVMDEDFDEEEKEVK